MDYMNFLSGKFRKAPESKGFRSLKSSNHIKKYEAR